MACSLTVRAALALCWGVNLLAGAATLKGTITNGTTGKPAAGEEVLLLSMASAEIGRGKTDDAGRFRFAIAGTPAPRLVVRVLHQGAAFYTTAPAGVSSVEVQVYDVARKLDDVIAWGFERVHTAGDTLQVVQETVVRNASNPPRLLMSSRTFEIQLPPEAELVGGAVQTGGGQPEKRAPMPVGENGRYYFASPLPPGDSRFAVAYQLPYRGEAVLEPKLLSYPLRQFTVVLPKSMKFESRTPGVFQPAQGEAGTSVQQTAEKPAQPLAFRISGTGTLRPPTGGAPANAGRPAAPAPHSREQWIVVGSLALVLAAGLGGALAHRRKLWRSHSVEAAALSASASRTEAADSVIR
jgi:hypothetical protein